MRGAYVCMCVLAMSLPARAALYNANEVPVLYVPVSARATALGNSLYCSEDEAVRYNPAYLGTMEHGIFNATYGFFQRGISFSSLALEIKTGTIGWAAGMSDIRQRYDQYSGPDSARLGEVSVSQSLFSLASGFKGGDGRVLIGTSIRILTDSIDGVSNSGYSVDVGGGYLVSSTLRAGMALKNAVTITNTADDRIGNSIVVAGAWQPQLRLFGPGNDRKNLLSAALTKSPAPGVSTSLGWESILYDRLAVRFGYDRDYPVFGLGFAYAPAAIDIAAAFKEQGLLYFMTVVWSFGNTAAPAAAAVKPVERPRASRESAPAPGTSPADEDGRLDALLGDGWAALRENRLDDAQGSFAAALRIDPACGPALEGQQAVRQSRGKVRAKEEIGAYLAQGKKSIGEGDYARAHRAYRAALNIDPDNEKARRGVGTTVAYVERELGEQLKTFTREQGEHVDLSTEVAMEISDSGTFVHLVNALRLLSARQYRQSCAEWQKVQPHRGSMFEKYDAAFAAVLEREFEQLTARSARFADKGSYGAAVAELNTTLKVPGLTVNEAQRIKGIIASYDYVGRQIAKNSIEKAEELLRGGNQRDAALCLERALRCGYETERIQGMLREIRAVAPVVENVAPRQGAVSGRRQSGTTRSAPAPSRAARRATMDPAVRQKLLKEYRLKASELYLQNRFGECREYLRKILYLDPQDRDARMYLDRVSDILKAQGE